MNRRLSPLEHVVWLIDRSIPQNFPVVAHLSGIPENFEKKIRIVLDILQKKYPPLACKISGLEEPEFSMESVPAIPLTIDFIREGYTWKDVMEKEMKEPISWFQGPLTRATLLFDAGKTECYLIVTFCHVVADATSGVTFIQELLNLTAQPGDIDTLDAGPAREVLPAPDQLIKKDLIFEEYSDIIELPVSLEYPGDVNISPDQRTTRVIQQKLNPQETKQIVLRSKQEKTSVHGALCAALMQSFVQQARTFPEVPNEGPITLGCVTPVDMRRHLSRDVSSDIGDFISQAIHFQPIDDETSLWQTAREIKNSLQREIMAGNDIKGILGAAQLLHPLPDSLELARSLNKSSGDVIATNLGRLNFPLQLGDIIVENIHFSVGVNADGKNGFGIAVTTFRDCVTINFLYAEPFHTKERAELIVKNAMKRLRDSIA